MARYVAITTCSGSGGLFVAYEGEAGELPAEVVTKAGQRFTGGRPAPWDMLTDTLVKNIQVYTRSHVQRHYSRIWQEYIEDESEVWPTETIK